jgi:hypothetical protein
MGSPGFTAPERIRGGDATPASDLWSLGATLYAAAEGRGPYEQRGGAITTMSAIINEDAPVATHSGRLAPVIAALLRREPTARPSASAAARMFAQILPLLAEITDKPHEPTHPIAVRSAPVPQPTAADASPVPARPADSTPDGPAADGPAADDSAQAPGPELAPEPDAEVTVSPAPASSAPAAPEDEDQAGETDSETDAPEANMSEADTPEAAAQAAVEEPEPSPEAGSDADADAELEPEAAEDTPTPAAEAAEEPGDSEEEGAAKAAAVMVLEAAPRSEVGQTLIDRKPAGYRPTQLSIPVARPAPGPTFTASQPRDRAAPTFSAARQDHSGAAQAEPQPAYGPPPPGAAQRGPYPGSPSAFNGSAAGQYAGPTHAHPDLSRKYTPGTGGGRAQRRRWPWRWIALLIGAVVLAVAIGAGVAYALHDRGPATTGANSKTVDAATSDESVNALNDPSAGVPAGWRHVQVTAAQAKSAAAGFTIDLPPGWTESRQRLATDFHGPHNMMLEVDLTAHHYQNMLKEGEYIEGRSTPNWTGYKLLYLQPVPVRATNGALWQFTRTLASGLTLAADDILFIKPTPAGSQSYAVYIRAPSNGWGDIYLPEFKKILPTFQTLPAS